uniref:Receptor expression-enhancing protein n=1 Tax=Panagrolaimus sp. ES5 TaxID=591445 RepID=A0AC34FFV1_9BILA
MASKSKIGAISGRHPTGSVPSPSPLTPSGVAVVATTPTTGTPACAYAEVTSFRDIKPQLMKALYHSNNATLERSFGKIEASCGIKREQLVYGGAAILGLYLIFGSFAQLICNLIGFAYPAYASVKAVRTENKDDDTQWLIYWCVFSCFSIADFFACFIMSYIPIYWIAKVIFLLYLALPQTKGAIRLYVKYVNPAITKIDALLANYVKTA